MATPPVGSLVVPSPTFRAAMDTGEGAALLLATLRGSGKLYYPATDQTFWVPMREVRAIPSEAVPADCQELFLSGLLRLLETEECTIDRVDGASITLALEPRSMRALQLELQLASLPRAAGAGG